MNINFSKKDILIMVGCLVLLAVNLGAVGNAGRQKAMESVCLSNLKQWGDAFSMWLNDHDGNFMDGKNKWFHALAPYYGAAYRTAEVRREYKLRFCPAAMGFADEGANQPFVAWVSKPLAGSEVWQQYYWDGSYGTNSYIYYGATSSYSNFWKNANVKNSNEIPILLDSAAFGSRPTSTDQPPQYRGEIVGYTSAAFMKQFCIDRHGPFNNTLFMDFSARPVGLKELYTLKWHRTYNTCGQWTKCGGVEPNDWPEWMRDFKDY